tara:strand:+ start:392 stop:922 length:531 start_codon:yes stop_codon:yes gene_type:complete
MILRKFKYKCVNSTNDVAISLIKKNIKSGIVISQMQKKGRGRVGRKWISLQGNLFVSIFFSIEKINMNISQLTKNNAKLIIKLLSKYYKKEIKLKLPNDILIGKKKICGILQETVKKNNVQYLIIGIGINLLKNPMIKKYPTTNLYDLTKNKISINQATKELSFIFLNFLKSQKVF